MDSKQPNDISILISQLDTLLNQDYLREDDRKMVRDVHYFLINNLNHHPKTDKTESLADGAWLKKVEELFIKNFRESQFKVEWVAYEINLSERQFTRRLKQLTGLTPNHYLRELRLQTAREYLQSGKHKTIKEVSYAVGFLDAPYFSRLFQERFGLLPSELLK